MTCPHQPCQGERRKSAHPENGGHEGRANYSEEQIIGFLRAGRSRDSRSEVCHKGGFSDATFYKWRAKFGEHGKWPDAKRLRELESGEQTQKLLAEAHLVSRAQGRLPG